MHVNWPSRSCPLSPQTTRTTREDRSLAWSRTRSRGPVTRRRGTMRRPWLSAIFVFAGLFAAGHAQAGLIPTNVSITPDGSNFRWTYAVVVTTDVKVNPNDYF